MPWSALVLDTDRKCFILNIDQQRLKDAPGFDKDHWPSMADSGWGESLHTYYNRDPYWISRSDYVDPDVPPTAH